jgi:potassium voltage-gated channel Shaw-related subfamily C protein
MYIYYFNKNIFLFSSYRDTQDVLCGLDRLDLDAEPIAEEEIPRKFGWDYDPTIRHKNMSIQEYMRTLPWYTRVQPRIWQLFEEPYSSSAAKVYCLNENLFH